MNWVLIIMLSTPSGDFIDKTAEVLPSRAECQAKAQKVVRRTAMGLQQHPICVTMDHWTGKQPMANVALD